MASINFPALEAIKRAFIAEYQYLSKHGGYRVLGASWGVSQGTAWRMVNNPDYVPKKEEIIDQLLLAAHDKGVYRKVIQPRERVEIDPDIDKETLKKIRNLTTAERTKILVDYLK